MLNISRDDAIQRLIVLLQGNDAIGQLSLEQIVQFAEMADMEFCRQGSEVIKQGDPAENFYVVIAGELRAIDPRETPPRLLNYHTTGSIVGLATGEIGQSSFIKKPLKLKEILSNLRPLGEQPVEILFGILGQNCILDDFNGGRPEAGLLEKAAQPHN